ncbi:MAG: glycerophosphodiester phosphodiesterase [Promethearchaeati archaeon]
MGHRGTRKDFDENTIKAFRAAIKSGADYIEFDIRKTKDGKLIIFHDETIDRVTNKKGKIEEFNLKEIRKLRTRNKGDQIPLLKNVLTKFRKEINFMVELKIKGIEGVVIDLIENLNLLNQTIISSRDYALLLKIKNDFEELKTCYNITKGKGLTLEDFLEDKINQNINPSLDMISLRSSKISEEFIEICHNNKIFALTWDFLEYSEPIKKIKELISLGINGILFDNYQNIPIIKNWLKKNFP